LTVGKQIAPGPSLIVGEHQQYFNNDCGFSGGYAVGMQSKLSTTSMMSGQCLRQGNFLGFSSCDKEMITVSRCPLRQPQSVNSMHIAYLLSHWFQQNYSINTVFFPNF